MRARRDGEGPNAELFFLLRLTNKYDRFACDGQLEPAFLPSPVKLFPSFFFRCFQKKADACGPRGRHSAKEVGDMLGVEGYRNGLRGVEAFGAGGSDAALLVLFSSWLIGGAVCRGWRSCKPSRP